MRAEQTNILNALITQQNKNEKAAILVESYADDIDKALLVINSALCSGMAWDDVTSMVAAETVMGNCIASMIVKIHYVIYLTVVVIVIVVVVVVVVVTS